MSPQPPVYSHDMGNIPSTPKCGTFRHEATKYNPLLLGPTLGSVKATTYDLPSRQNFQHEYGLRQVRDGSSSAEVLGNWAAHEGTTNKLPGRDFKALNKMAMMEGKVTTTQIREFRATNDIRLKLGTEKSSFQAPWDSTTTFGRSTHASEPFGDLVSHQHRFAWVNNQPPASELKAAMAPKKPQSTKSSKLLAEAAQKKLILEEEKVLWKMPSYKNVPAKIGMQG